jgi:glycosyltransferase involved in cell wall biosynthesis
VLVRILQVIHQFPPHSSQGSEVYCYTLARQLHASDDVGVFHISNTSRRWLRRLHRALHEGLAIYHCVDRGEYARLAEWPNVFLRDSFEAVLDEFRPEVVHFHNYLSLGDDLVSAARCRGAAVVYTLHDYGLICPNALLLRDDGKLCGKANADFFEACCPTSIRTTGWERQTSPWRARMPSLARWRLFARQQSHPLIGTVLAAFIRAGTRLGGNPAATDVERKRAFFLDRTRQIFRDVDLFLAPSQFLLQRYVSCGLSRDKIEYLRYGMRRLAAPRQARDGTHVRFGYIGALHPHKGIDLLLEAFRGLGDRASLHVHGSVFDSPISRSYWRRLRAAEVGSVFFHGAYDNTRVGAILAAVDVLVVPSLWYENSPLTIHEAFLAGVPVITADVGGMAELVHDRVDGLLFRLGDVANLRQKLCEVIEKPELLERLQAGIPAVPDIETHAATMRARYAEVLSRVRA